MRVLIVDDHEPVRRGIRSLLARRPDWSVCGEAADGFEAVAMARELRPDVVLMDMSMPRMSGADATRLIRRDVPDAQVIIVTQNDPGTVRQHAAQLGARGYVSKATLAHDLLPAILKIIGDHDGEEPAKKSKAKTVRGRGKAKWLSGGGDLGHLIREHDWSSTPLGPINRWPQSLKSAVNLMLNSQHPMWIGWGREMTFLYNDAYISVLSLAKHPGSLGRPTREVWSEIWDDVVGPLSKKVFEKGEPSFVNDMQLFMSRGEYVEEVYYSFSYSPIYDESGKVAGLFCPSTETTAKVLHARRLRTLSELSAKALLEKTTDAASASSIETISHNPDDVPFCLLYLLDSGRTTATLKGTAQLQQGIDRVSPWTIDLTGEGAGSELWPMREVIEDFQPRLVSLESIESLPRGLAGQPVTEAMVLPVSSPGQEHPIGLLIAGVNPTRKLDAEYRTFFTLIADQVGTAIQTARAAEEEKKRLEALAEIDRAKTEFFSNVSHEFRTPLTLMLGPIEDALADGDRLPREDRELIETAQRNSMRLLRLVNALLDFSRIEAGGMRASYEPTDLAKLTAELASAFEPATERAGLKLIIDCPPLPDPVYVDREMWEKIVFNLLSNAFKFTFEGEIEVSLRPAGDAVELAVRDTGTGIPEEGLPHLFERFYRVKDGRGRTFEGSGIGLALVQELAKLHGGVVRVQSEVNRGSTFTVSIPFGKEHLRADRIGARRSSEKSGIPADTYVQEALGWLPVPEPAFSSQKDRGADRHPIPAELPPAEAASAGRPHVLLADDNADMRNYIQRLLSAEYDVEAVADGELALESLRERPPDLILSDIMMPRVGGAALLRAVRADERLRNIPVILLSARAGEESRVEGIESGADDYLVKPFSARELLARVRSHIRMARSREEAGAIERKLRLDAELLAAIVASSDDAIVSKSLDGIITSWNGGAERTFGYTAQEAIGKPITLIIPPDRLGEEADIIARLRRGERVDHFQTVRVRKDGAKIDVSLTISPVRDSTGTVIGASKVARDITEQMKSERALRASEERFRAIVETTPECVKLVAPDGTLLHMNSSGLQMIDAAGAEAVVGRSVYDLIAPEFREKYRLFNERICSGERGSVEFDIIGLAGHRRQMETHAAPFRTPDGRMVQLGITLDVTDRKQSEERERRIAAEAMAANAKFRAVFEQTPVFAGIMTTAGVVVDANKLSLEACGYRAEEVLGRPFWETGWWQRHPESREKIRAATPLAAQGLPYREMLRYSWVDGTERLVDFALYPILDDNGKVLCLDPTGVDITDLKQAEENYRTLAETLDAEVRARTRELEERNADVVRQSEQLRELSWRLLRAQDDERRHVARELHDSAGQTLTVLGINLALFIQKAGRNAPELAADAERIQESVQQLHREIRTTSYLLHPPLLDETGLSSALAWYIQGLVERSGLDVTLHIAKEFGRLPRDMELAIFRLVQECLTNIHRHSGSRTAKIRVERDAEQVRVEVEDHGRGMSAARLAEIQSGGSGVGIRGMRERLRQFGGSLAIESSSTGTRIVVTIPLATEAAGEDGAQAKENDAIDGEPLPRGSGSGRASGLRAGGNP